MNFFCVMEFSPAAEEFLFVAILTDKAAADALAAHGGRCVVEWSLDHVVRQVIAIKMAEFKGDVTITVKALGKDRVQIEGAAA